MMQAPPHASMLRGGTTWPLWFVGVSIILGVSALASTWMGTRHGRQAKIVWTVIIVCLPVLGAVGWYALGRERRRHPR